MHCKNQKGFTLIETVVAILILSLTVGALLTLTANGIFSVRYARNQIVANNLAQEALEFVRNSRDTARQKYNAGDSQYSWANWLLNYNVGTSGLSNGDLSNPTGCFQSGQHQGCIVSPFTDQTASGDPTSTVWQMNYSGSCTGQPSNATSCPNIWYYPDTGLYSYPSRGPDISISGNTLPIETTYIRWVNMSLSPDQQQLTVNVTIEWKNGITSRTLTESMLLTNWSQ